MWYPKFIFSDNPKNSIRHIGWKEFFKFFFMYIIYKILKLLRIKELK